MIAKARPSQGASVGSATSEPSATSRAISDIGISPIASLSATIAFIMAGESQVMAGSVAEARRDPRLPPSPFPPSPCRKFDSRSCGTRVVSVSG